MVIYSHELDLQQQRVVPSPPTAVPEQHLWTDTQVPGHSEGVHLSDDTLQGRGGRGEASTIAATGPLLPFDVPQPLILVVSYVEW